MSKQLEPEKRNAFLDEYNENLKVRVMMHEQEAREFIPTQYALLRAAGFAATTAGDRLSMDLSEIWSDRTIRRYKPIEARHLEKARKDTTKPYFEKAESGVGHDDDIDEEDDEFFEDKMKESNKNVSETVPPITRKCPACNTVIAIGDSYSLSIYK